jgi:hypothetical protein
VEPGTDGRLEEAATGREAKPIGPMDVHELIGEGGPAPGDGRRVRERLKGGRRTTPDGG